MAKYQVIRAWHGVSVGQVVELREVHSSLTANVIPVADMQPTPDKGAELLKLAQAEVDDMRKQAEEKVAQYVEDAQAQIQGEIKEITESARAEAKSIIDSANAEAERIKAEAVKQAGELTPSTPDAATKSTKAK